ncbi:fungal specific transcription factor domain-containing protein [Colletotrichum lupini]|uniref:Fungal specific transcription factor domain-containing protein n=1 Tax=Colletotrichum lupini TaxID=145971 RepID=A0A9Q8STP0_9PEZI|nr:fungal specific transcription factor domain-containing protein [Colletotrichum lupini]UQC83263.1 fungal specific transcription factor domain-containing protein [Colletotrichum lupini]
MQQMQKPTVIPISQLSPRPTAVSRTASTATATTSPARSTTQHRPSISASLPTSPDSAGTAATPAVTPAVLGIGYLGFTSFCGIYEETRSSLKQLQPSSAAPIGEIGTTAYCGLECSPPLTAQALETCLTILRHVPDRETGLKLFDSHLSPSDGWIRLAAKHMMISLYNTFPQYFPAGEHGRRPDDAQLTALAQLTKAAGSGGNTLLLFMCSKRTIIESLFSGDAKTVALSTFLGFHDEVAAAPGAGYKPTVCSEIKRKLFSYVFYVDKVLASFAGRPPLISRRYARTPPPLDLKDDHLLSDEASLARHVAALDENGWNTKGELYSATIVRARVMLAHIRDEIFEIALGQGSVTLVETLLEIKERQLRTVAGFPDIMTLREEDVQNRKLDISLLYTRLIMKLEHLQNMFFIERLLAKRGHDDGTLLSVSFEMVSKTLMFWTNMDRLSCMNGDFEWLVMAYAAPGGGILCMELLKPTLQGGHHPQNPQVSRSSIIQKLSLLVGFLDWVSPTAPNGDLCADCKVIIQRVLDQALNSPAASASSAVDGALPAGVMLDVPMDWDFSTQLDFNFDLLDTFDWLRPEVSSSQQSS